MRLNGFRLVKMSLPRVSLPVVFLNVLALFLSACGGGSSNGMGGSGGGSGTIPPSTANEWTWMRGADADLPVPPGSSGPWSEPYNSDPYYGTLGASGAHTTPGGRNSSAYWTDKNGNFWLFGGDGLDGSPEPIEGLLNDLWEFSPATNQWTWMGGSSTLSHVCAYAYCGLPGIYGVQGAPSPSNLPGGREVAVTWTDSAGNFWLFGGQGTDSVGVQGYLNDLWEFNPTTGEWVWMSGSSTVGTNPQGQEGSYGTQGVAAPGNVPPGLIEAASWIDKNDNLWLFGGQGVTSVGGMGYDFNNLWEFSPATKEWTWISGSGGGENPDYGVYGTQGIPAASNIPSGRHGATAWTDSSGKFWLFGGFGTYPANQSWVGSNFQNDLWEFDPTTGQWTWMSGTAGGVPNSFGAPAPPPGSYGALGVASSSNVPGGRGGASGWADSSGNLWLFSGTGSDSLGTYGDLNDLWEFSPAKKQWIWMSGNATAWPGGVYGVEGTAAGANTPGGRYDSASWMDRNGNFWLFAGWGNITEVNGGSTALNDLWRYQP